MTSLIRWVLVTSVAAASLAACGAPRQAQDDIPPVGAPAMPAGAQHLLRGFDEVQYFTEYRSNTLLEYDWPKGDSSIGQITTFPNALFECTKGSGTFWVVAFEKILEFKVGGKEPIVTLTNPFASFSYPQGCAVDPTTGNLAVTISNGFIDIFKPGSNQGTTFSTGLAGALFDGYDDKGDLFADGLTSGFVFQLVELPKGRSTFKDISLINGFDLPGSIQWDGKYLTIGGQETSDAIDRYQMDGTKATLIATVTFTGGPGVSYWISRPYLFGSSGGVYRYPAGGSPIATLSGLSYPIGVVSLRAR